MSIPQPKDLHESNIWFRQPEEEVKSNEMKLHDLFGRELGVLCSSYPRNTLKSGIPIFKKTVTPWRYSLLGTNLYLFQVDPDMLYLKTKYPQENMVVVQCRKLHSRHTHIIEEIKKMVCQRIGVTYMPLLVRYTEIKEVSTNS